MGNSKKFIEQGNASIIKEVCYPYKVPMYIYRAIVDFCGEQLANVYVQKTEHGDKLCCEPIQKFMVDIANGDLIVYTIYSDQREHFDEKACFVIRKLLWEKRKDINQLQKYPGKRQEALLSWPTIITSNNVMYYKDALNIISLLQRTDKLTKDGIKLNERRSNDELYWRNMRDVEFMRRYDWGEIHCSWGASMQNAKIEQHIYSSLETLEKELLKKAEEIYKLELDYIFPIKEFKKYLVRRQEDKRGDGSGDRHC